MHQSREAHHPARPLHSPRGVHDSEASEPASRRGSIGTVAAQGLPQSKHGQRLKPLTCAFAPPAGLEPAPYGLEVKLALSSWCRPGASPQVESGPSSSRFDPGRGCYNDRIARRIASMTAGAPTRRTSPGRALSRMPSAGIQAAPCQVELAGRARFHRSPLSSARSTARSSSNALRRSPVIAQQTCSLARANAACPHAFARSGRPCSTSASRSLSQWTSAKARSITASPRPLTIALPLPYTLSRPRMP